MIVQQQLPEPPARQQSGYRTFADYHESECNAYCQDGLHTFVFFGPPKDATEILEVARRRFEGSWADACVAEVRPAPEAPVPDSVYSLRQGRDKAPEANHVAWLAFMRFRTEQP